MSWPATFLVGAGPVAVALAGAWRRSGVEVVGLWARRGDAAVAAAGLAGVDGFSGLWPKAMANAEVIVIAVKDQAITEVAAQLVAASQISVRQVLLHCAGARAAAEVLAPAVGSSGGVGTLHPLRAIAGGAATTRSFAGTVFGVEGDDRGREVARVLVEALGGRPLMLAATDMAGYHAAAVIAANYVVTLIDAAVDALGEKADHEVVTALVELSTGALENIRQRGVVAGLTGPIQRGDEATVRRHLAALSPELQRVYRVLGQRTVGIASRNPDVDSTMLSAIAAALAEGEEA